ncbi:hypothetical protein ACWGB8_14965 [Kitasatospora sp. NPDC054939]
MRKRFALGPAVVAAAVLVAVAVMAAWAGCGAGAEPRASGPTAPPEPVPPPFDPLADCVLGITPWLQSTVGGGTDPGDYQHMGLSSAQGGALRELQRQARALMAKGPLPSGWVATEVQRACAAIVAARATVGAKPTGWP